MLAELAYMKCLDFFRGLEIWSVALWCTLSWLVPSLSNQETETGPSPLHLVFSFLSSSLLLYCSVETLKAVKWRRHFFSVTLSFLFVISRSRRHVSFPGDHRAIRPPANRKHFIWSAWQHIDINVDNAALALHSLASNFPTIFLLFCYNFKISIDLSL